MSTSGPNGLAGLWPALDAALTKNKLGGLALQGAQGAQLKEQTQDSALQALLRGLNSPQQGGPQMPQLAQQKLGALAFPEQAAARAQEQVFPSAPKQVIIPKDSRLGTLGSDGYKEILGAAADLPKLPEGMGPDGQAIPGYLDFARRKAEATRAPDKPEDAWSAMSPQEILAAGLDPAGTYQKNTKGQIQVITQPKQNNPTEAQQKYAFNGRRLAGAMETLGGIFKTNPDAVSSGTLEATQDSWIPGVPMLGRALAGDDEQIVRNNMGDVIDAALTLGTGAAYSKEQLAAQRAALLPKAGESDSVKADKFKKLLTLYDQARTNAHSAGVPLPDPAIFESIYKPKAAGAKVPPKFGGTTPPGPAPIGKNGQPMVWVP